MGMNMRKARCPTLLVGEVLRAGVDMRMRDVLSALRLTFEPRKGWEDSREGLRQRWKKGMDEGKRGEGS